MNIPQHIFREYDIRGLAEQDLTNETAFHLGKAIGSFVRRGGGRKLVVGRDARDSGVRLNSAFTEGLLSTGCDVLQIGVTPTPVNYWAIQHLGCDGGIQITGSHNPPEYNGFKLTLLGESLSGQAIMNLWHLIQKQEYETGKGHIENIDVLPLYLKDLQHLLMPAKRPLKIVIDAGNGVGGLTAVPLYQQLGYTIIPLYCEPDGNFPNHHADPTVEENLIELQQAVKNHQADLGIAFDGDADRLGVVDKHGEIIWGDRLMILLSRALLQSLPQATIIGEVKCSKTLYDDIALHGGKPVMWRAGHSLIKAHMKSCKAALAGEMSGHIFYHHRYYGFDDAVYAGGRLLEILSHSSNASITERLNDVPHWVSTPEIRYDCTEEQKFKIAQKVLEQFQHEEAFKQCTIVSIDGVRVEWADGWGLVRPSNTQPLLVLRFEAKTQDRLQQIQTIFQQKIERAQEGMLLNQEVSV